jgi:hypothetical protein
MPLKAHPPRIPKPKLLRSNPLRKSLIVSGIDPSELDLINDEDIYIGYRRPSLTREVRPYLNDSDDISEDIQWKLFLIRQLAMLKYREVHGQKRA